MEERRARRCRHSSVLQMTLGSSFLVMDNDARGVDEDEKAETDPTP